MADAKATCFKCKKVIQDKIVTALDKKWHPEHFTCLICDKEIDGTFNEHNGDPVCSDCYLNKFSDICYACKLPIGGKVVKALNQTWHEEHFICGGPCKKPMTGQSFFEKEGLPYCKEDYEKLFASKCKACSKIISDNAIIALNGHWHKDCFKCKKCSKTITDKSFAVADNKPMCTTCA